MGCWWSSCWKSVISFPQWAPLSLTFARPFNLLPTHPRPVQSTLHRRRCCCHPPRPSRRRRCPCRCPWWRSLTFVHPFNLLPTHPGRSNFVSPQNLFSDFWSSEFVFRFFVFRISFQIFCLQNLFSLIFSQNLFYFLSLTFVHPFHPFANPSKAGLKHTSDKWNESRLDAIASPNFDTIQWWWCPNLTKLCFMLFVVVCIDIQFSCGFMSGVIGHFCHQWAQTSPSRLNVIKIQTTSELTSQRRGKVVISRSPDTL